MSTVGASDVDLHIFLPFSTAKRSVELSMCEYISWQIHSYSFIGLSLTLVDRDTETNSEKKTFIKCTDDTGGIIDPYLIKFSFSEWFLMFN